MFVSWRKALRGCKEEHMLDQMLYPRYHVLVSRSKICGTEILAVAGRPCR